MKTLQIDEARFRVLIRQWTRPADGVAIGQVENVVSIKNLWEAIDSLRCKSHPICDNESRYDSGYCALCDTRFNEGKGKRITYPEP